MNIGENKNALTATANFENIPNDLGASLKAWIATNRLIII